MEKAEIKTDHPCNTYSRPSRSCYDPCGEAQEELRETLGSASFLADSKERGVEVPPEILNARMRAIPVFMAAVKSRFFSSNDLIVSSKVKNVLDLPCGYTARGIKLL